MHRRVRCVRQHRNTENLSFEKKISKTRVYYERREVVSWVFCLGTPDRQHQLVLRTIFVGHYKGRAQYFACGVLARGHGVLQDGVELFHILLPNSSLVDLKRMRKGRRKGKTSSTLTLPFYRKLRVPYPRHIADLRPPSHQVSPI